MRLFATRIIFLHGYRRFSCDFCCFMAFKQSLQFVYKLTNDRFGTKSSKLLLVFEHFPPNNPWKHSLYLFYACFAGNRSWFFKSKQSKSHFLCPIMPFSRPNTKNYWRFDSGLGPLSSTLREIDAKIIVTSRYLTNGNYMFCSINKH